jgi:AAA domain, putative AbiEii toxin, Type IV TA system
MLREIHIEHFRSFREIRAENCGQINLILGRNNVGKTAFLEAVELLREPNPRNLKRTKSEPFMSREQARRLYVSEWQWSFYDGDTSRPFILHSEEDEGSTRVSAHYQERDERDEVIFRPGMDYGEDLTILERRISVFMESFANSQQLLPTQIEAFLRPGESSPEVRVSGPRVARPISLLGSDRGRSSSGANRFSRLLGTDMERVLVECLRSLDSRLIKLEVKSEPAGRGTSYSSLIAWLEGLRRPIPIELMGEGFSSLATILLYLMTQRGRVGLIDEIENGLHYSVLESVWKGVAEACARRQVQLFATSHSYECVEAAYRAFEDRPDLLRVFRLDRQNDGTVKARAFDYKHLMTALEQGLDVR